MSRKAGEWIFITNGKATTLIRENCPIPEGFRRGLSRKKQHKTNVNCIVCGKEIEIYISELKYKKFYCSKDCSGIAHSAAMKRNWSNPEYKQRCIESGNKTRSTRDKKPPKNSPPSCIINCIICGKELRVYPSEVEYKNTCSKACSSIKRSKSSTLRWAKEGAKEAQSALLNQVFANPEMRKRVSDGVITAIESGKLNPGENIRKFIANGGSEKYWETKKITGKKGKFCSSKNCEVLFYHSMWELVRMISLEEDGTVLRYKKAPFAIPYILNGKKHRYYPDFLVIYRMGKGCVLEEIKPLALTETVENQAKFNAARQWSKEQGIPFVLITDNQIVELAAKNSQKVDLVL